MIKNYSETVVWEDPLIVLIEETLIYEGGDEVSTYTFYNNGERIMTSISEEGKQAALADILNALEDAEYAD